jgi:hypothetical protein
LRFEPREIALPRLFGNGKNLFETMCARSNFVSTEEDG